MRMNRRLYRCRENRMLAGVAGGLAEYTGLDPSLVRILWLVSVFFWGAGVLLYIAMAIIVPLEPITPEAAAAHAADVAAGIAAPHRHREGSGRVVTFIGVVLLIIGSLAMIDAYLPGWATWRQLWPLLFLGAGGFLVVTSMRRNAGEDGGSGAPGLPGAPAPNGLGGGPNGAPTPTES
jgi:phage shock protein C